MTNTNLITGFLGSGKTTTIRHLLAQKPEQEKWAVLVNEFGEVGIDGALLADTGAVLREIPGGCMCCVNGLPMQVGLNMLLQQAKPDRLLIEPTGLGHPKQILALLNSEAYQSWLKLDATLCLLDARQLSDQRIVENENFRDQLACADIIIANKSEQYEAQDCDALKDWHATQQYSQRIVSATQGKIDVELLYQPHLNHTQLSNAAHHHGTSSKQGLAALALPKTQRWCRALNKSDEYTSCGWIFDAETIFDTVELLDWVRLAPTERIKGVMRIKEGTLLVNRQGDNLHIETRPIAPVDSRVELITREETQWNTLQSCLLSTRLV